MNSPQSQSEKHFGTDFSAPENSQNSNWDFGTNNNNNELKQLETQIIDSVTNNQSKLKAIKFLKRQPVQLKKELQEDWETNKSNFQNKELEENIKKQKHTIVFKLIGKIVENKSNYLKQEQALIQFTIQKIEDYYITIDTNQKINGENFQLKNLRNQLNELSVKLPVELFVKNYLKRIIKYNDQFKSEMSKIKEILETQLREIRENQSKEGKDEEQKISVSLENLKILEQRCQKIIEKKKAEGNKYKSLHFNQSDFNKLWEDQKKLVMKIKEKLEQGELTFIKETFKNQAIDQNLIEVVTNLISDQTKNLIEEKKEEKIEEKLIEEKLKQVKDQFIQQQWQNIQREQKVKSSINQIEKQKKKEQKQKKYDQKQNSNSELPKVFFEQPICVQIFLQNSEMESGNRQEYLNEGSSNCNSPYRIEDDDSYSNHNIQKILNGQSKRVKQQKL